MRLLFVFGYILLICIFDVIGTNEELDAKLGFGKGFLFSFYGFIALA